MSFFDNAIVASLPMLPRFLTKRVASRYVAGSSLEDAISTVSQIMNEGGRATIDLLGENAQTRKESEEAVSTYTRVLSTIQKENLDASISVKLTHLGLRLDRDFCISNIDMLAKEAKKMSNFVRIDMEDHTTTTDTLAIYSKMREKHGNIGVAIQAYLRRSKDDVKSLASERTNFRLCKGIYAEPPEVAYHDMAKINENYMDILRIMLEAGSFVGIATHDDELLARSQKLTEDMGLGTKDYEFQMLLGVKEKERREIISMGHKMRVYVPFGRDWYPYSLRRLKENPRLARHILRETLKWERFP